MLRGLTGKRDIWNCSRLGPYFLDHSLMKTCFENNFARMFEPSDCNDLKALEKKKRKLHDLGVQIDQGENIRL